MTKYYQRKAECYQHEVELVDHLAEHHLEIKSHIRMTSI